MTYKVNISIEDSEKKLKTEYEIPVVQNLDVEQSRESPFATMWDMIVRISATAFEPGGGVVRMVQPDRMDPRKRIEMLEERKAEIDKEIQAITDAQWSWKPNA